MFSDLNTDRCCIDEKSSHTPAWNNFADIIGFCNPEGHSSEMQLLSVGSLPLQKAADVLRIWKYCGIRNEERFLPEYQTLRLCGTPENNTDSFPNISNLIIGILCHSNEPVLRNAAAILMEIHPEICKEPKLALRRFLHFIIGFP